MALRALNGTRLNSSAKAELLQELERGEFTTAWLAAEQLGDQGVQEAIPLLREALHSEDFILCGKSMVALVALRDRESYGEIIQRFVLTANPRVALHGAEAIALMGERDKVLDMFRKACNSSLPGPVRDGILNAAADLCGFNESAYLFLKQAEDDRRAAAEILTELLSRQMPADWVNRFGEALGQSADPARLRSLLREEAGRRSTEAQKLLAAFLRQVPEGSISCKTAGCLALWLASQD